jgi:methyl-accepting chemotaxis protein
MKLRLRCGIGAKIYLLIAFCVAGSIAVGAFQLIELSRGLEVQKQIELSHLGELALGIVAKEYEASEKGQVSVEEAKQRAVDRLRAMRYGENEYFWINDIQPRMVMHPTKPELDGKDLSGLVDPSGKKVFVEFAEIVKRQGRGFVDYEWPKPGFDSPHPKKSFVIAFEPWGWVIGTGVYVDDLRSQVRGAARDSIVIGLATLAGVTTVAAFVARRMSRAVSLVTSALNNLATGHPEERTLPSDRGDEMGDLLRAYLKLKDDVRLSLRLMQMVEGMPIGVMCADATKDWSIDYMNPAFKTIFAPIAKDLPAPIDSIVGRSIDIFHNRPDQQRTILNDATRYPMTTKITFAGRTFELNLSAIRDKRGAVTGAMVSWQDVSQLASIADRFEESVRVVVETIHLSSSQLREQAALMAEVASGTEAQAQTVATCAAQASSSVTSVVTDAERLRTSISEIGRHVTHSNEITSQAVESTRRASAVIKRLDDAAQHIGQMVGLIGTIAGQTNLLALNATIESARAGDAGRGFAVVAAEVKQLATETAKAAEVIVSQIGAIQTATDEAIESIDVIGVVIDRLLNISTKISAAVEQQSAATSEIAVNAQRTSRGTNEVTTAIGEVTGATNQSSQVSRVMLGSAEDMMTQMARLNEEVKDFLAEVRTA